MWVGAGLVANDKRANALQIYLSKPLTRIEYIVGKLVILGAFLLMVTWVPAILLLVLQVAFSGSFSFLRQNLYLFPAVTVFAFLQVLLAAFTMLALSSLSKSSRYVAILYAGAYWFSHAVFGVIYADHRQHEAVVALAARQSESARRHHLPAAAALFARRPSCRLLAMVGAHRAVDLGPRAAGPRGGGGVMTRLREDASAGQAVRRAQRSSRPTKLSKWYGQVIGLNDVTVSVPAGITGLLGPNGAGKSTFMKLMTGQLKPSKGTITVLGEPIWGNPSLYFRIGFCPDQDAFYDRMTGLEWVAALVRLNGYSRGASRSRRRSGRSRRWTCSTRPTGRSAATARACASA